MAARTQPQFQICQIMATARFRFYEELNDFLAPQHRGEEFEYDCAREATVKHSIEALGVPHTEVELIVVNGGSVGFDHRVRNGDRISVYPVFEALDVTPLVRVREKPLRVTRFIADAHLGGLARLLRMAGFDTLYDNGWSDDEIRQRAGADHRIILTRDRGLLKVRTVTHGCYVHATDVKAQFREVVGRLELASSFAPLTRCLHCNRPLEPISKQEVVERIPENVARRHERFSTCADCGRIYWEGGHWERMRAMLGEMVSMSAASAQSAQQATDRATGGHVPTGAS